MRRDPDGRAEELAGLPRTRSIGRWQRLWRPFWVLPLVIVVAAVLAGYLLPQLDLLAAEDLPYLFPGGPSGARAVLGTIAGAMISVTGLVFSITMVVIQLASSQYSPRILGDFLGSRITQATLGVFAASFTYALTVLRSVRGDAGQGGAFVPQLAVSVAFLLVLASVGMFLAFIHHITESIRVPTVVERLGESTAEVVRRYFPEPPTKDARQDSPPWRAPEGMERQTVETRGHGAVVEVDHRALVSRAEQHDLVIEVLVQVGDAVPAGSPALRVWRRASAAPLDEDALVPIRSAVVVERDRVLNQDPALGVRKLVDVAERALSPGVNDPSTAVRVLDELHRVLRLAVARADLPAHIALEGRSRLVHRPQRVAQLIDLALAEPLHYGEHSLQVPRRVAAMIDDLERVALPEHRPTLERWSRRARSLVRAQDQPRSD